jgi:hypothetical protein
VCTSVAVCGPVRLLLASRGSGERGSAHGSQNAKMRASVPSREREKAAARATAGRGEVSRRRPWTTVVHTTWVPLLRKGRSGIATSRVRATTVTQHAHQCFQLYKLCARSRMRLCASASCVHRRAVRIALCECASDSRRQSGTAERRQSRSRIACWRKHNDSNEIQVFPHV